MGVSPVPDRHVPVMLDRVVALLGPALERPGAVLVDATLGLGGHSESFLRAFPEVRLVGIDRDSEALAGARSRLSAFGERTTFVHAVYDDLPRVLERLGLPKVQAVLMDLGVSSLQLDEPDRGFAYAYDAPLDMRMDRSTGLSAAEVLNTYSADQLARVLRRYGQERFARRIADAVVRQRERTPLARSSQLVDLVRAAVPAPARRTGGHPAKRTFQALRIEVNAELGALERALPAALDALAVRGRIAVLSYQSLEDRLVKRALAAGLRDDVPPDLPVSGRGPELRLLTRGAERPDATEVAANPRASSAHLRAAERLRSAA
jgi:16S rRNA (cytosine1402-N4)-methyltransferase